MLFVKYNLVLRGDQITDWVQENELPLAWAFSKRRESLTNNRIVAKRLALETFKVRSRVWD